MPTTHVSIGLSCDVAYILGERGLRGSAYPFDWVISPLPAVIAAIETGVPDLCGGLVDMGGMPHETCAGKRRDFERVRRMFSTSSGIMFVHDFPDENGSNVGDDSLAAAREKYGRRADRFRRLLRGDPGGKVVFCLERDTLSAGRYDKHYEANPELRPRMRFSAREIDEHLSRLAGVLALLYPSLEYEFLRIDADGAPEMKRQRRAMARGGFDAPRLMRWIEES